MAPQPHQHPPGVPLAVHGGVPTGLAGRLTAVGEGLIHSLDLTGDRATYLVGPVRTPGAVTDLISVDGSVLAFTETADIVSLDPTGTTQRIDLAGHRHVPASSPILDPITGELHLLARDALGDHAHIVVSAGRLTRRSRRIDLVGDDIHRIALSHGHLVIAAGTAIGLQPRYGERRTTWVSTGSAAWTPVHAFEVDGAVVVHVLAPSLERWVVHLATESVTSDTVDGAPIRFARSIAVGDAPTALWTVGDRTITRHDFRTMGAIRRDLTPKVPGDFLLVPDGAGRHDARTWFIGLVHDTSAGTSEAQLIDADDPASLPVASIRLPQPLPVDARCTWTPDPQVPRPPHAATQEHPT